MSNSLKVEKDHHEVAESDDEPDEW